MRARQCLPIHRHLLVALILNVPQKSKTTLFTCPPSPVVFLNVPQTRSIRQHYLPVRHCWWRWFWVCRKQVYDNTCSPLLVALILNVPQTRSIWKHYLPVRRCWWRWSWMCRKQEAYDNTCSPLLVALILNVSQTRSIWQYLFTIAGGVDPERASNKKYMTIPVRHCWWRWSWTCRKQEV